MFFEYLQNNSGGNFIHDGTAGISQHVIIEANDSNDANQIAESIGLYFDGADDCECCGYRWLSASHWEQSLLPSIYGTPVWRHFATEPTCHIDWMGRHPDAYVHYKDGSIEAWKMGQPCRLVMEGGK